MILRISMWYTANICRPLKHGGHRDILIYIHERIYTSVLLWNGVPIGQLCFKNLEITGTVSLHSHPLSHTPHDGTAWILLCMLPPPVKFTRCLSTYNIRLPWRQLLM